jgi:hypothetical protein
MKREAAILCHLEGFVRPLAFLVVLAFLDMSCQGVARSVRVPLAGNPRLEEAAHCVSRCRSASDSHAAYRACLRSCPMAHTFMGPCPDEPPERAVCAGDDPHGPHDAGALLVALIVVGIVVFVLGGLIVLAGAASG